MPRNYCYIYQELVGEEGDVVGHIAYSLYKKNKSQFNIQSSDPTRFRTMHIESASMAPIDVETTHLLDKRPKTKGNKHHIVSLNLNDSSSHHNFRSSMTLRKIES